MASLDDDGNEDQYGGGDIDDLFDYDVDDLLKNSDTRIPEPEDPDNNATATGLGGEEDNSGGALGVDEEVKIRKRKPVVKLDEDLLLSDRGIPRIQRHAPKRIKLKGKGHEAGDLKRIVQFYQLWADQMFPKANFSDSMEIIEKLGHSKRVQIQRVEWINQTKPGYVNPSEIGQEGDNHENEGGGAITRPAAAATTAAGATAEGGMEHDDSFFLPGGANDSFDDDDLDPDMSLLEAPSRPLRTTAQSSNADRFDDDDDFADAMEAMAEAESAQGNTSTNKPKNTFDDDFADDMEAMAEYM